MTEGEKLNWVVGLLLFCTISILIFLKFIGTDIINLKEDINKQNIKHEYIRILNYHIDDKDTIFIDTTLIKLK